MKVCRFTNKEYDKSDGEKCILYGVKFKGNKILGCNVHKENS